MTITWKAAPAKIGAKGFDSFAPVTESILTQAGNDGCEFVVRYAHNITKDEISMLGQLGFAYMLATYADAFDGVDARSKALAVGYPSGCTDWLDVESVSPKLVDPRDPISELIVKINKWALEVRTIYDSGGYFGCQQLLTWQELTKLAIDRYWESQSLVVDRFGNPARPATGWSMRQVGADEKAYGTLVDWDFIFPDARGRVPTWAEPSIGSREETP